MEEYVLPNADLTKTAAAIMLAVLLSIPVSLFMSAGAGGSDPFADDQAPVADAGDDIDNVLLNDIVTFNGSRSTDEDLKTCTWLWECISHTGVQLNGQNTPSPTYKIAIVDTLEFRLTLTDAGGQSSTDNVIVFVLENQRPTAIVLSPAPSPPYYFRAEPIEFSANGSTDPEARPLSFRWTDNISGELSTSRYFTRTLSALGWHGITLNVSDPNGGFDEEALSIFVREDPAPPKAGFTVSPSRSDLVYEKGENITLDASLTTDPNSGEDLNFSWRTNLSANLLLGFGVRISVRLVEGFHNITLKVTDNDLLTDSAWTHLEVRNNRPQARITALDVKMRAGKPTVNISQSVTLLASSSFDEDGDALSYSWDFGDGGTAYGEAVEHSWPDFGKFDITLVADDGSKREPRDADTYSIYINSIPRAVMETRVEITVGETFSITANGSADDDGDALTYRWDMDSDGTIDTEGFTAYHIYYEERTFTVTLYVSDGFAVATATGEFPATVPNSRPVALILGYDERENETIIVPMDGDRGEAELDASESYDPDDDIDGNRVIDGRERNNLSFAWDIDAEADSDDDGTKDNDVDRKGKTVRITLTDITIKRIVLFATDKRGLTGRLEVGLKGDHAPVITNLKISPATTVYVNASITFTATVKDEDRSDARNIRYTFLFGDDGKIIGSAPNEVTHIYSEAGTYEVVVNVTDGYLYTLFSASIRLVVFDPPVLTSPRDSAIVSGTVTVKGRVDVIDGYVVRTVEVSVDGEAWEEADGTSFFEYRLQTTKLKDGKHTLTVRATVDDRVSSTTEVQITVQNQTDGGSNLLGIIAGIAAVLVLFVVFYLLFVRKKKGREEEILAPPVEGPGPPGPGIMPSMPPPTIGLPSLQANMALPPQTGPAFIAAPVKSPSEPAQPQRPKRVRVKCPACGKIFSEDDLGERPLRTTCKHCGAKGAIDHLPWDKEPQKDEGKETEAKKGPEPVSIVCPSCNELFEIAGRTTEAKCPHCGAAGDLDEGTISLLEERLREHEPKEVMLKCPKCEGKFKVKEGDTDIICPFCGAQGRVPR